MLKECFILIKNSSPKSKKKFEALLLLNLNNFANLINKNIL